MAHKNGFSRTLNLKVSRKYHISVCLVLVGVRKSKSYAQRRGPRDYATSRLGSVSHQSDTNVEHCKGEHNAVGYNFRMKCYPQNLVLPFACNSLSGMQVGSRRLPSRGWQGVTVKPTFFALLADDFRLRSRTHEVSVEAFARAPSPTTRKFFACGANTGRAPIRAFASRAGPRDRPVWDP